MVSHSSFLLSDDLTKTAGETRVVELEGRTEKECSMDSQKIAAGNEKAAEKKWNPVRSMLYTKR